MRLTGKDTFHAIQTPLPPVVLISSAFEELYAVTSPEAQVALSLSLKVVEGSDRWIGVWVRQWRLWKDWWGNRGSLDIIWK
jgi:hypothetical protein